jgi:heat shock protein HslJ
MKKLAQLGFMFMALMLSMSACQSTSQANTGQSASTSQLRNTLWKLTSLNGKTVATPQSQRMASLTLNSQESRARIVTACNGGAAGFTMSGKTLKFTAAMSTKMMCEPEKMLQEQSFMKVISDTTHYKIKGETLELYDAANKLLASFHSEYLK